MLILRHAWLNPRDKHMTTGRINQVAADTGPSTLAAPGQGRRLAAADGRAARVAQHFALVANGRLHGTKVSQLFGTTAPRRTARRRRPCYGRPLPPGGGPQLHQYLEAQKALHPDCRAPLDMRARPGLVLSGADGCWGEGWNQPRTRTIPFC